MNTLPGLGTSTTKVVYVVFALLLLAKCLVGGQPVATVSTAAARGDLGAPAFKAMQDRQDAVRRSQMVVNAVWTRGGW